MNAHATPIHDPTALHAWVVALAHELGFALVGVTAPAESSRAAALRAWLDAGKHGEMTWMAETVEERCDPRRLLPSVASIICVADRYHDGSRDCEQIVQEPSEARGRIARYARSKDYHNLVRDRIHKLRHAMQKRFPDASFRLTGDIQPLMERDVHQAAFNGQIGKNTLMLVPGEGSWFVLGELHTSLLITPSTRPPAWNRDDPCGSCTRCIDACSTGAITPFSVDASKCIAYLTIEQRGTIGPEFFGAMNGWIFGCDDCQTVCPHCQPKKRRAVDERMGSVAARYEERLNSVPLLELLGWSEEDRARLIMSSALKRATLAMMKRNAVVLLAEHAAKHAATCEAIEARLRSIQLDSTEDEVVREQCAIAIAWLASQRA